MHRKKMLLALKIYLVILLSLWMEMAGGPVSAYCLEPWDIEKG